MTKHWTVPVTASLATLLALFAPAPLARADIFRWQYGDYTQGKQPSAMLAPDGAGANAVPGANLSNRNLTMAYLCGAYLSGANFTQANLTQAAFGGTGGSYSSIPGATLMNATFSQANLTQADFGGYTGIDLEGYTFFYGGADLTGANLVQANLTGASFFTATLTNANLSQTTLNANFSGATLTGANLTGADVRGAGFDLAYVFPYYALGSGITPTQLYSTASYQAHDLTGIGLRKNNLADVNLAGQNLTNAYLERATLTGANLSQSNLTNANLYGARLSGANLSQANLTGAIVVYASFASAGITRDQLYSTASYQAHNLNGIDLAGNNLAGVNLTGQDLGYANFSFATLTGADLTYANFPSANLAYANLSQANLTNANFSVAFIDEEYGVPIVSSANLTGANLSQANLTNVNFAGLAGYDEYGEFYISPGAILVYANLTGADSRGSNFQYATLFGANTSNLIESDGHIAGLNLTASTSLVVRDYDGNPAATPPTGPLPIVVEQHLAMNATGTLRLVFDADPWDSLISFSPGIPVALGGTLDLTFALGVNIATQSGRTIDLFDWTGVTPTGAFTVTSPYTWDLSQLYTTGQIRLGPAIPGDFNGNGVVDTADYTAWRDGLGSTYTQADYDVWKTHFGAVSPGIGAGSGAALPSAEPLSAAVPEPATLVPLALGLSLLVGRNSRRSRTPVAV